MRALDLVKDCVGKSLRGRFKDNRTGDIYRDGYLDTAVIGVSSLKFYSEKIKKYIGFELEELRHLDKID